MGGNKLKINCKELSQNILDDCKKKLDGRTGIVTIIQWGEDSASSRYVKNKIKRIEYVGLTANHIHMPSSMGSIDIGVEIIKANNDNNVVGLMLQLPVPEEYRNCDIEHELLNMIDPMKDMDALTDYWKLKLYNGSNELLPCTVRGCLDIMKHHYGDITGKTVAILGRSDIVGKPMIHALLNENCTPICIHSKSEMNHHIFVGVDVIISATGVRNIIESGRIRSKHLIIDVGINFDENGKLVGDIDEEVKTNCANAYTSVPQGVGICTTANVIGNVIRLMDMRRSND